jgi:hypothetical protein
VEQQRGIQKHAVEYAGLKERESAIAFKSTDARMTKAEQEWGAELGEAIGQR